MLNRSKLKYRTVKLSWWFLFITVILALFAPILANDEALVTSENGSWSFPAFESGKQKLHPDKVDFALRAPIPYGENSIDFNNAQAIGPFAQQQVSGSFNRHWLGTDELGRDVLAQMLYGSRTAFTVGFGAVLLAAFLGLLIGGIAAYWGDHSLRFNKVPFWIQTSLWFFSLIMLVSIPPWGIYGLENRMLFSYLLILSVTLVISILLHFLLAKFNWKRQQMIAVDMLLSRLIEIMDALPILLIIIGLSAILKPSLYSVILIIGISSWAGIAKFFRAEVLKIKQLPYVESARAIGLPDFRVLVKHILPNAIPPVLVTLSFGFSAAILIEATLSFLGMGLGAESASWGAMLANARHNFDAWWLTLFPGLAIFACVVSCNVIGDAVSRESYKRKD